MSLQKNYNKVIIAFAFLVLFSLKSFSQSNGFELIKNMEITDLIHEHLEKYYVDEPQVGHLSKVAIDAMLK